MQLYAFNLPNRSNDGATDYRDARKAWETRAIATAGGFTYLGVAQGAWSDNGTLYNEAMHVYQVATRPAFANVLLADAFELFPDQHTIYRAELGTADIFERPHAMVQS